jgi:CarboxypepD_reg-like domain
MGLRLAVLLLLALTAEAAEIKGKVTNVLGGEPLWRVEVFLLETKTGVVTSPSGEFDIANLAPGSYTLRLNAVGYRLLTIPIKLGGAADIKEFAITMVPDNFRHTDKVEVHGDVFQASDSPATTEMNLTASEIRETSTVFADDPFRAVQTLPGVSAEGNNEFFAEFSVMGAPFSSVSTYIDDVLVPNPFHEIGNFAEGASLGVLTSEVVEEMKLMPAAYPEKFGDAAGAALDVRTRQGSRGGPLFRISAGIVASEVLAEGGLGSERNGSWLVSARKSYINYLIKNRVENAANVGFYDGDLKLNYDIAPRQNVNFFATGGHTDLNDSTAVDSNTIATGRSDFALARAGWRWAINPHLLVDARGAFFREPEELRNPASQILETTDHQEWVGGTGLTWNWAKDEVLEAGWTTRRVRQSYSSASYDTLGGVGTARSTGSEFRHSGYVQQAASAAKGRLHFLAGVRWDSLQQLDYHPLSAQGSMSVRATATTEFQLAAGQYQQFPALEEWSTMCLTPGNMPEKSDHYSAAVEQRLGENTRIRLQVFDRQDSFSLALIPGQTVDAVSGACPHSAEPLRNSTFQRDYSRGVQLVVQRRSANRLSGWLGYTLASAQQRQYNINNPIFPCPPYCVLSSAYSPSLEDQRNSLNGFAMYRLKPSVNLSGKFLYGSGFPVSTGIFVLVGTSYQQVGSQTLRFPYHRLDVRADKDWAFAHWKLTVYGEVLNLTNHYNSRFVYSSVIDPNTGQAQVKTLQGLPVTPTAGIVFQF